MAAGDQQVCTAVGSMAFRKQAHRAYHYRLHIYLRERNSPIRFHLLSDLSCPSDVSAMIIYPAAGLRVGASFA